MKTEEFSIKGLHCPSCARLVQEDVSKLDGVESAVVDLAAQKLHLIYDENVFQLTKFEASIKSAGFCLNR